MKKAETFSKIASLLLAAVLITGIAAGCGKTEEPSSLDLSSASLDSFPVSSEPDVEVDPDNYIVWQVYDDSYADIWQKKINTLLKEKGADYTVKIEAYDSIFGASEEKSTIEILKEMKDSGTQADVISIRAERQASLLDPNSGEFIFEHEEPYQDAVAESILLSLDDYLETPAGQQLTDAIHPVDLERSKINGSSYGISQTLRQVRALFFNKEYLDKYHIKTEDLSPNIFENEELLQMIKEEEKGAVPPYVRMRLTYQVLGPRIWNVLGDGPFSYQSQTDSFVNVFETETCKELYRQLYALKDKNLAIEGVDGKGFDDFFVTEGIVSTDQVFETTYTFLDSNDQEVQKKL